MAGLDARATMVKRPTFDEDDSISDYLTHPFIARGYLLKLSHKKKWQRRWWEIRGPYFMYWVSEKQATSTRRGADPESVSMPDAAIDLRCITAAFLDGSELVLHSHSEREFRLKPSNLADQAHMKSWLTATRFRIAEAGKFATPAGSGDGEIVMSDEPEEEVLEAQAENMTSFSTGAVTAGIQASVESVGGGMAKMGLGSSPAKAAAALATGTAAAAAAEAAEAAPAASAAEAAPAPTPPVAAISIGDVPAPIKSVWPEDYEVKIILGPLENKKHPTYQCALYKGGSTSPVSGEGCIKRFGAYRDLNQLLLDKYSVECPVHFPKSTAKSMLGLGATEVSKRCEDLDAWLQGLINAPLGQSAASTVVKFLGITDPVLNGASYASLTEIQEKS